MKGVLSSHIKKPAPASLEVHSSAAEPAVRVLMRLFQGCSAVAWGTASSKQVLLQAKTVHY
jgi:hypothetical protein